MHKTNYAQMLDYFQNHLGIESQADFEARLNVLDIDDIVCIYDHWGIYGGDLCLKLFNQLDRNPRVSSSKSNYHMAEENLRKAKFVLMLNDYEKFPFSLAYKLGVLGCAILSTDCCRIYGEQLWNTLDSLPKDIRFVIDTKYGLRFSPSTTYISIAKKLGVSRYVIKRRESMGLNILNSLQHKFVYPA